MSKDQSNVTPKLPKQAPPVPAAQSDQNTVTATKRKAQAKTNEPSKRAATQVAQKTTTKPKAQSKKGILLHKRAPIRAALQPHEIYVTGSKSRRSIVPLVKRGVQLLTHRLKTHDLVSVHGLGAAIPQALRVALAIKTELFDQVTLQCYTGTATLFDDCQKPLETTGSGEDPNVAMEVEADDGDNDDDDDEYFTSVRQNSTIRIDIRLLPAAKKTIL
ncbi:hypothetical protein H4R33_007170 [Dimargaris cristalligena]|nr:hypothetical protein H4R33_007170 [Dimargaris cristalligena]